MCTDAGFFLEKNFRGDKTKFSRKDGGQAKIRKIYVVHTLSTCTSFSMLESDSACLVLIIHVISFNFFQ